MLSRLDLAEPNSDTASSIASFAFSTLWIQLSYAVTIPVITACTKLSAAIEASPSTSAIFATWENIPLILSLVLLVLYPSEETVLLNRWNASIASFKLLLSLTAPISSLTLSASFTSLLDSSIFVFLLR